MAARRPIRLPQYFLARHKHRHCREGSISACPKKPSACPSARWSLSSDDAKDWEDKEAKELPQQHKREREPHQSRKRIAPNKAPETKSKQRYTMIPTCRSIDLSRACFLPIRLPSTTSYFHDMPADWLVTPQRISERKKMIHTQINKET
jgi:hypothetical protein